MAATRYSYSPSHDLTALEDRMERLRQDASAVAFEHSAMLLQSFADAASLANQVAAGGEAYPVGVREIARRAHIDLAASVLNLRSIVQRAR